jgi:ribosomal protein L37AE/L43A
MLAFLTAPINSVARSNWSFRLTNPRGIDRSMTNRHTCPCCSHVLLRHIDSTGLYWYCSHCHEKMAAWS